MAYMTSHRPFNRVNGWHEAPPDNPGTHGGVARGAGAVGGAGVRVEPAKAL